MNNEHESKWLSTKYIVVSLILFWPLGFVLLYLRLSKNYGKYVAATYTLLGVGFFFFIAGLLFFMSEENTIEERIIMGIIMISIGSLCFFQGVVREKKLKEYKKYLPYIKSRKKIRLETLSNKLNVDLEIVKLTILEMLDKEIINGYFSEDEYELIITDKNNKKTDLTEKAKETKVVKCPSCGAKNNVIVGEKKNCEFCGTPLQ